MNDAQLYLTVRIGDTRFALPAQAIEAVVQIPQISRVPGIGPGVPGMIAIRSRVIVLIDPAAHIGMAQAEPPKYALIVAVDGFSYAVAVSDIGDVSAIGTLSACSRAIANQWAQVTPQLSHVDGRPLLVVDPSKFVDLVTPSQAVAA
jgi:purine-binding chemotaxis protein CheW